MALHREITGCRACSSTRLESVLDLGTLAISDFILPGEAEHRAPLELVCCQDCTLVQLRHTVDRRHLFRNYYYRSATNESMVAALRDVVDDACRRVELRPDDYVLDLGANDGTLLAMYPRHIWAHGFEPAGNMAREAMRNAHARIWPTFWPPRGWDLPDKYKIITSIACFYAVDEPNGFVAAIKRALHPDGIWVCQMQDFGGMVAVTGFDNVVHEHVTYWTEESFAALLGRHGLQVLDRSYNLTNGASVRYIIGHGPLKVWRPDKARALEFGAQLGAFAHRVRALKEETLALLERLRGEGQLVVGMAASTKANTLLQYYGIMPDLLPEIIDRNPDKAGRLMVGSHIPIREEGPTDASAFFALAWHFLDSFRARYSNFAGKWIKPLPTLTVYDGGGACLYIPEEVSEKRWVRTSCAIP